MSIVAALRASPASWSQDSLSAMQTSRPRRRLAQDLLRQRNAILERIAEEIQELNERPRNERSQMAKELPKLMAMRRGTG